MEGVVDTGEGSSSLGAGDILGALFTNLSGSY